MCARVDATSNTSRDMWVADRVVESIHEIERDGADQGPDAFDCHGADQFGSCLGAGLQTGLVGGKQRLERVDVVDSPDA